MRCKCDAIAYPLAGRTGNLRRTALFEPAGPRPQMAPGVDFRAIEATAPLHDKYPYHNAYNEARIHLAFQYRSPALILYA